MVTTVNTEMFDEGRRERNADDHGRVHGATHKIKAKGVVEYPLNIPFAAAEGLSTYWYQTTGAFGGTVLDERASRSSGPDRRIQGRGVDGRRAQERTRAPGNINVTDRRVSRP